jgi:hypothetical protein
MMASFSSTLYNDQFFVVVKTSGSTTVTFMDALRRPIAPFSGPLWVLILVVFGAVGVLIAWENTEEGVTVSVWDFVFQFMPVAILKGLNAVNLGEVKDVPLTTSGSWITHFFLGFTFQVLITGYTAVVTNRLMEDRTTAVGTLREAVEANLNICANADFAPGLISQYPDIAPLLVPTPLATELTAMDDGLCDAAIVYEDYWRAARSFGQKAHCTNKVRLLDTVTVLANAIPVNGAMERALSFAIARDVEAGRYTARRDEARRNYTYSMCREIGINRARAQFDLRDLGAPLIFLISAAVVSLIVTRIGRCIDRYVARVKEKIDTDGDGEVTPRELQRALLREIRADARRHSQVITEGARRRFSLAQGKKPLYGRLATAQASQPQRSTHPEGHAFESERTAPVPSAGSTMTGRLSLRRVPSNEPSSASPKLVDPTQQSVSVRLLLPDPAELPASIEPTALGRRRGGGRGYA